MLLKGTAHWAKIVGKPQKGYTPGEYEWSVDISVDAATSKQLQELGAGSYIKNKGDDRGDFVSFKRKSIRRDGEEAKPYEIVDHHGEPWGNKLIGNGSTLNVVYTLNEIPAVGTAKARMKPSAIKFQVWDHVAYENQGRGSDEFPTRGKQEVTEESWS